MILHEKNAQKVILSPVELTVEYNSVLHECCLAKELQSRIAKYEHRLAIIKRCTCESSNPVQIVDNNSR